MLEKQASPGKALPGLLVSTLEYPADSRKRGVQFVLTSRAESLGARLACCAVATLYADARRRRATTPTA